MTMLAEWDKELFLIINSWGNSFLDYWMAWPTYGGTYWVLIPVFIMVWIWDRKNFIAKSFILFLGQTAGGLLAQIIKWIVDTPRPYAVFSSQNIRIRYVFDLLTEHSFPSGHTASIFALVTVSNYLYGRKMLWLYLPAFWVGVTRIYVGAHFPSDVLGGMVIGILSGLVVIKVAGRYAGAWLKPEIKTG